MSSFLSSNAQISIESSPYGNVVIESFFENELALAAKVCSDRSIEKAVPIGKVGEVGDLQCWAMSYTPDLAEISSSAIGVLGSDDLWNLIFDMYRCQTQRCEPARTAITGNRYKPTDLRMPLKHSNHSAIAE